MNTGIVQGLQQNLRGESRNLATLDLGWPIPIIFKQEVTPKPAGTIAVVESSTIIPNPQDCGSVGFSKQDVPHGISRVLTIVTDLDKGGVQRTAQLFAQGYQALGLDSRVLAVHAGGEREQYLAASGIPIWTGVTSSSISSIREWGPDLLHIHAHCIAPAEISALLDSLPDCILVEKNVFSELTPFTTRVTCSFQLSLWCLWRFHRQRQLRSMPTALVSNAADCTAFGRADPAAVSSFKSSYGIPADSFVIGRIGQSHESKWSSLLIEAVESLLSDPSAPPIHLLLVNPPLFILHQLAASPVRRHTTVIDRIVGDDNLSIAYSAIDVFALAADCGESFGNVLAESLLCETPAVVLSTPWTNNTQCEVVGHQVGGLVATTRAGFTRALKVLEGDEDLRRRLGRQGRQRIVAHYDYVQVARQALWAAAGRRTEPSLSRLTQSIIRIYKDSIDRPDPLTLAVLRLGLPLQLLRYTTGYQPMRTLLQRLLRRFGLLPAARSVH